MKYLLQEKIFRRSPIPPEFILFRRSVTGTLISFSHEYTVPDDSDFFLANVCSHGNATGGETIISNVISLRRFSMPSADFVVLAREYSTVPGGSSSLLYSNGIYIPRQTIIRSEVTFSAAVQSKDCALNIVGWMVHGYDVELYP